MNRVIPSEARNPGRSFAALRMTAALMFRCIAALSLAAVTSASADYRNHPRVPALLDKLRLEHGFTPAELDGVIAALGKAEQIPQLIVAEQKAAEKVLTWDAYRRIHLREDNIRNGARFLAEHAALLARAEAIYGVPPAVIVAILGVETKYGSYTGPHRTLDALATQGFEHPTRTPFFFGELVEFFALCRDQRYDPLTVKGSYAGAVGAAQFMPSNYRRLAIDFDGDGRRDLWKVPDAIGSIGNYMVNYAPAKAWQRGLPLVVAVTLGDEPGAAWPLNAKMLTHRLGDFLRVGVTPVVPMPPETPVGLLELTVSGDPVPQKEYWLALNNFYTVMSYNPRVYYAMAVTQLAGEVQRAAQGNVTASR
jgi:membrane-bound lytic murein transglycosylase B